MNIEIETYPIEQIREQFPALQRIQGDYFVGYFDGPSSTQIAISVIDAITTYMKTGVANPGGVHQATRETSSILETTREYVGKFLNTEKENIAFGQNMTTLALQIAQNMTGNIPHGKGNIVLTEFNRRSNVTPWENLTKDTGLALNVLEYDPTSKRLTLERIEECINEETKIVVLGLASNVFGTLSESSRIIERAREVGAYVILDCSFSIAHLPIDLRALDVDVLFCSAYKFFGPHVGIVAIKNEMEDVLGMAKAEVIKKVIEIGSINVEGIIGVTEAIRFIASIGEGNLLEEQLASAYTRIKAYENALATRLRQGLAEIDGVELYQAKDDVPKLPIITFQVKGMEGKLVCYHLSQKYALYLEYGDFEADYTIEKLAVTSEQLVRVGIAPYNTFEEVERLVEGVRYIVEHEVD